MKLIIKLFIISCLSCGTLFSQETDSIPKNEKEGKEIITMLHFGLSNSTALGDNFLNDAYEIGLGVETGVDVLFNRNYIVGLKYDIIGADNVKPERVGNIDRTGIRTLILNGGYMHHFSSDFALTGLIGVGYGNYKNRVTREVDFVDESFVLSLQTRLDFNFSENFGMYAAARFRQDFMNIETTQELESYFNQTQILTFSLGIKFMVF